MTLKEDATDAQLNELAKMYRLKLMDRYERLCIFQSLEFLSEQTLLSLFTSPLIETVEETSIGKTHAPIEPPKPVEPEECLNSRVRVVDIPADHEIPAHGLDRFMFEVRFDEAGTYLLSGTLQCGPTMKVDLPKFWVEFRGQFTANDI